MMTAGDCNEVKVVEGMKVAVTSWMHDIYRWLI